MNHKRLSLNPPASRGGRGLGAPWVRGGAAIGPFRRVIANLQSS